MMNRPTRAFWNRLDRDEREGRITRDERNREQAETYGWCEKHNQPAPARDIHNQPVCIECVREAQQR